MEQSDQDAWGPQFVRTVAQNVLFWRQRRGLSAQKLADRCAALGHPIKRSVLSNLESGYRTTITVPEVFVLAHALDVPPIVILLPVGRATSVQVSPTVELEIDDAMGWVLGEQTIGWLDATDDIPITEHGAEAPVELGATDGLLLIDCLGLHDTALTRIQLAGYPSSLIDGGDRSRVPSGVPHWDVIDDVWDIMGRARSSLFGPAATEESLLVEVDRALSGLSAVRRLMRDMEWVPPGLPDEVKFIDDPASSRARQRFLREMRQVIARRMQAAAEEGQQVAATPPST